LAIRPAVGRSTPCRDFQSISVCPSYSSPPPARGELHAGWEIMKSGTANNVCCSSDDGDRIPQYLTPAPEPRCLPLAGLPYRVRHGVSALRTERPPGPIEIAATLHGDRRAANCSSWCSSPLNQIRSGIFTNEAWEHRRGLIREKAGEQEYRGAPQSHRVPEGSRCAPRSISARDGPAAMGRTDNHRAVIDCGLVGHLVGSLAVNFGLAGVG
jgi:hypothetical protein